MFAIDKALLPIKAHYILYSGTESLRRMIPLILHEKGVPNQVVGMICSIMTLFGLLITAVGGTIADYYKIHHTLLVTILVVASIGTNIIYFLPDLPETAYETLNTDEAGVVKMHLTDIYELEGKGLVESYEMKPNSILNETRKIDFAELMTTPVKPNSMLNETSKIDFSELMATPEFLFLGFSYLTEQSTQGLVLSLTDTIVFKSLDGETTKYGQQKLFCEIGITINAALTGYLVDLYSEGLPQKDYMPTFVISGVLKALNIIVLLKLKLPEAPKEEKTEDKEAKKISDLFNLKYSMYLVSVFVMGIAMNFMWVFKSLVAEDIINQYDPDFGNQNLLQGLMHSMQCLSGALFYGISGFLIRCLGHTKVFILGFSFMGLHFVLFYVVSNPWYILPLELLNGPSYILFRATAASYAAKIAPPEAIATLQAASQFFFFLGYGISGLVGSFVYQSFGGYLTFLLMGCFVFAFTIFYALFKTILKLKDRPASEDVKKTTDLEADQAVCDLYPTPPPSPQMSGYYNLSNSFIDAFKEINFTQTPEFVTFAKHSRTSIDSGVHDLFNESSDCNDVNVRSSTPRKSASITPNHSSIFMDVDSPKLVSRSPMNKKLTTLDSAEKAIILSPSFSKRRISLWEYPGVASQKLD